MARNQAVKPGRNPYLDDDEEDVVDDYTFLAHPQQGSSGYMFGNGNQKSENNDYVQKRQLLLEEKRKIEERTLESSKVSLGLIYETENVGLQTAEELVRQGEKLSNIDSSLDTINSTMRVTQKHLTSMKSFFGGLFNKATPETAGVPNSKSTPGLTSRPSAYKSNLGTTIEQISKESASRSADNHPALMNRGIDTSGFKFDEDDEDNNQPKRSTAGHALRSRAIDRQLDSNLSEMDLGINRLKNLALGLGNEIEQQNELVSNVLTKAERSEDTIGHQNRQMRQILKK